jgi:hypothetical protein
VAFVRNMLQVIKSHEILKRRVETPPLLDKLAVKELKDTFRGGG